MNQPGYYWYDLETSGKDSRKDRILQFAGLRTDTGLQPMGEPHVWFCRLAPDVLPDPEASLVTGLTPQLLESQGRVEAEVLQDIHQQLMLPGTCALGWNTLRFDDEFLRHSFFRNLMDPYEREWRGGNSRWDMIDVVRMAYALRPDALDWPVGDDGAVSFRLEKLAAVNEVSHEHAHDALSDVMATIGLARKLQVSQPRLWHYAEQHRSRQSIQHLLRIGLPDPVLHVSTRFGIAQRNLGIILPLQLSTKRQHQMLAVNLAVHPLESVRTAYSDSGRQSPLYWIAMNRCPMVVPWQALRHEDIERLAIPVAQIRQHMDLWRNDPELQRMVHEFVAHSFDAEHAVPADPDFSLYSGGFLNDADKRKLAGLRQQLREHNFVVAPSFDDPRLAEMLFR
ncbi:MAG: exodeoxyribonuclease, partial [Pseudomonadota bacterium]